mmetsp:Transcript_3762/g.13373  ORF Transcript_3762/g.13373 Transcript_3762/m.13373 type:complete len:108 (+) Transcript_3762:1314-1637(+)
MAFCPIKKYAPHVGTGKHYFHVLFCPICSWQALEKQNDSLEVHSSKCIGPVHQQGGANVNQVVTKPWAFGKISIPYPQNADGKWQFPQQQTIHPAEGELQVFHSLLL